jgi:hypothetical protein
MSQVHPNQQGVPVFQLSVVDHIRLSFGSVVTAYEGHAEAAARLALWGWYAKVVTMSAVALSAVLSGAALSAGRGLQIGAAIAATAALAACAGYVAFDPQPRIYGHRASAARLWLLCENYRALLAEVHDELLDLSALKERRAELLRDAAAVLEHTSPDDRYSYEIARKALKGLGGAGYSDADVDRYLPASLRKQTTAA